MIFVIDIGNTNTVLGVFQNDQLKHEWRLQTDRHKTEDELGMLLKSLFDYHDIAFSDVKGVIVSSVVPPIMRAVENMCQAYFKVEPLIVGRENINSSLKMNYPNPHEIGADRIVNAVGAVAEHKAPLIIIDFGTATTYCYIDEDEAYTGGIITPGIKISMDALYSKASKLPKIDIQQPNTVIGRSTIDAMQSGVYYGYVSQVDGTVTRIKEEMGNDMPVIATGGFAPLIAKGSETIDIVDSHLTLKGLYLIYKNNINKREKDGSV